MLRVLGSYPRGLLGGLRAAAILEGAFAYLSNRYGISTPPAFSDHARRIWPGPEAIRKELGSKTYEALRSVGAAMTLDEIAILIEESASARPAGEIGNFGGARAIDSPAMERPPAHTPVIYAGEPGAFAEDAVLAAFGDVDRSAVGSFRAVFEAFAAGPSTAAGVIPIENVVNGTVRENYDLLLEHELEIVGEVVVPVRLSLAALPGQSLDEIERVYSHIQALGQAEAFLRTRPWQLLTTYNTAGAGKSIVERGERGAAAVLSPRAAALFGLEILANDIQDVADNRTRFLILAPPGADVPVALEGGPPRTTLALAVRNEPGTLLAVLEVFARHGLNMSKLESRPSRERAWEYVFWVDLDADGADPETQAALAELDGVTTMLRILGSYPRGRGGSAAIATPRPFAGSPLGARRGSRSAAVPRQSARLALHRG